MYVIVWRFTVDPDHRADFEQAYGPSGPWANLFARAPGYAGTELVRVDPPGTYLTIDRWESGAAYQQFRQAWTSEYDELDRALELLTDTEELIGAGDTEPPR